MTDELSALIGDDPVETPGVVETPEPTPEPEQGVKQEVSEPPSETPKEQVEPDSWTKAAVLDERKKRQALEAEIEQLRKAQQQPEQKKVDLFEDPDAWQRNLSEQFNHQVLETRISMSREMFAAMKDDYEEAEAAFVDYAKQYPELITQMTQAAVPAKFAYEQGKKVLAFNEFQKFDAETVRAKIREEERAKVMAELQQQQSAKQSKVANLTPSLAAIQTQTVKDDPEPTLEQLLGR